MTCRLKLNTVMVVVASFYAFSVDTANALPQGGQVAAGDVTITQTSANTQVIKQTTSKGIINWSSYNVGVHDQVTYEQVNASAITLNRINPNSGVSQIYGRIISNGQVWLVNPAGIYFGPSAYINVGGLVASTASISDINFLGGNYKFTNAGEFNGSIVNQGTIIAAANGLLALIGAEVTNDGLIEARMGRVVLGAGEAFTISYGSNDMISFVIDTPGKKSTITNNGKLSANGGQILVSAKSASQTLDNVINMNGIAQARSVYKKNGEIIISGESAGGSQVKVSGKIIASGKNKNQRGGNVTILGNNISLDSSAVVDVSGHAGGGNILIGGNAHGAGKELNANQNYISAGASLDASAISTGNAGKVVVWSDENTQFYGSIIARGGNVSGDGGWVEVSGKNILDFNGLVDTSANAGLRGSLLLDPQFLIISDAGNNYFNGSNNLFSNNVGGTSVITPTSINAANANIILQANTDVMFVDPLAMSSLGSSLTVTAGRSILLNANVSTNNGDIYMTANSNVAISSDRLTTNVNNPIGDTETVDGNITMANGVSLSSGTAATSLTIDSTATAPFSPGSITINNVTAGTTSLTTPHNVIINGALTNTGAVIINAGGDITEAGSGLITSTSLTTTSVGTQLLNGNNTVSSLNLTNTGSGDISLINTQGLSITGISQSGGNLILNTNGAITQTGSISVSGTTDFDAHANAITLTNTSNNLTGGISLNNTGTNNISLTNNNPLVLAESFLGGGQLNLSANGSITQIGAISQSGAGAVTISLTSPGSDIHLNSYNNDISGTVTIGGNAANIHDFKMTTINAGAQLPTNLLAMTNLHDLDLNFTSSSANIDIPTVTSATGLINIISGGSLSTSGNISTNGGSITLQSGTGMTISNIINAGGGLISLSANDTGAGANNFLMTGAGAGVTTTNTSANAVTINVNNTAGGTGGAVLGNITTGVGGGITVTTKYGSNTSGGSITQAPATLLNTGANGSLNFSVGGVAQGIGTSLANILATTGSVTADTGTQGFYLTNSAAITLGAINNTGALSITAAGTIDQSGVLNVTGTSTFNVTTFGSDVILNTQANNLGPIASLGTLGNLRNLAIRNINVFASLPTSLLSLSNLQDVTIEFNNAPVAIPEATLKNIGNLIVVAGGAVTQLGQLNIPGSTSITTGAFTIALSTLNNIFAGPVSISNSGANNVTVTNNTSLILGDVSVGTGTLSISSTGAITQQLGTSIQQSSGAGLASFLSLGGLTLNNASNNIYVFSGNNLVNGDVSLINTAPTLTITTINTAGSGNINVSNTGNLITSSNITTSANGYINLASTGTMTIGGNIDTNGSGSITLAGQTKINLGANLTTSGGNIQFNNPVELTTHSLINSSTGDINFASTLDGAFSPTLTSSGVVTFSQAVGGLIPLSNLTTTFNSPGNTVISSNITTNGPQSYGNPITLNGNSTFLATGTNNITINGGVNWGGAYNLSLNANAIVLNGAMNGTSGTLALNAPTSATPNITTGANGSVNVGVFNLVNGYWSQTSSLPGFNAANFMINSGAIPASNVTFLRSAGGVGTTGSPYQIRDIYGLQGIQSNLSLLSLAYQLDNSFNASVTSGWNSGAGFIPIGTSSNPFTGTIKGQNNSISNLTINSSAASNIGLFGVISNAATISSLGLSSVNINSSLSGASNIGGMVGQNNGTITGSFTTGSVNASTNATNVGGLVGYNLGTITESTTTPPIASYSRANITVGTTAQNIGGLVGRNDGVFANISIAYSTGNIIAGNGSSNIGGLVGYDSSTAANSITNTYSISSITATSATNVGGLVGNEVSGRISNSYSSGPVPVSGTNIGGFIGNNSVLTNTNNFFDTTSSGAAVSVGLGSGLGVTPGCFSGTCPNGGSGTILSSGTTFSGATWSITSGPSAGTLPPISTWYILPGITRPMLAAEWSSTITNSHQLELMNFALGASYTLANNINISTALGNNADVFGGSSGGGFGPIGNTLTNFAGTFNGNNNTISNLTINSSLMTGTGLFGATSSSASITNVNLSNVTISNSATNASLTPIYVGALVGQNNGTITKSTSSGTVTVTGNYISNVGGLVGQNTGTITAPANSYSFSTSTVNSSGSNAANIGGLIGQNSSTGIVSNTYSSGAINITGDTASSIGGLIGDNFGNVTLAYSSSPVTISGLSPSNVGGFVGTSEGAGNISISYSDGTISLTNAGTTATNIGGFVGLVNSSSSTAIENTYSLSVMSLSGNGSNVGGLIGNQASGPISDSYSIGASTIAGVSNNVGGFIGNSAITTNTNNFFDLNTSGTATGVGSGSSSGITPTTTANMKLFSTFNSAGWDFLTPIWGILDTQSYPYFGALSIGIKVVNPVAISAPTSATNGATLTPVQLTNSGSDYYFLFKQSQITAGNGILFYNTDGLPANGIVVAPTGFSYTTPITLTMTANTIQVGGDNTAGISISNLGGSSAGGSNILFSTSGGLVLGNATHPNVTLLTNANTTLTIDRSVSSFGNADNMILNGPTIIDNNGSVINTSGTQTYNGNIALQSAANFSTSSLLGSIVINGNINGGTSPLTFSNVDANSVINGVLSGSGDVTMQGTGALTLTNDNTYSGDTILVSGTVKVNSASVISTPLGTGTLSFMGGTLSAGSAQVSPVANDYVTGGISSISQISGNNNLTLSGQGNLANGYILNITNTATTTLNGNLTGSGQLNENAGTLAISGANNSAYAGSVIINDNGTLQIGVSSNALGTGTLTLNNSNITAIVPNVNLNSSFTSNGTSSINGSNNINLSGPISLYSGALTISNGATTTLSGNLTGAGGLTIATPGSSTIVSGSNSPYVGATTINSGILEIGSATNALGTGTGNSLVLNGGALISSLPATLSNKFLVGSSGNASIGGTNSITIAGNGTLNNTLNIVNTAGDITLSGILSNGVTTGSILQNGIGGTLILSNSNSYGTAASTGTTITAGELVAQKSLALGVGNAIVNAGGQLSLDGLGGGSLSLQNPLFLSGTGVSGLGALVDKDVTGEGNNVLSLITLTGATTIGVSSPSVAESLTLSGGINNAGFTTTFNTAATGSSITETGVISGSGGLVMNGVGTLNLTASNSFNGNNIVNAGKVVVTNTQGLGLNNTTTVNTGGLVQVAGVTLVNSESFILNGGTLQGTALLLVQPGVTGTIHLAQNSSSTINTLGSGDNFLLAGLINGTSGPGQNGNLSLSGPGTITLDGTIGVATSINSLTNDTTFILNANTINSVANQTYNGLVTLNAPTTNLTTTATGDISFTNILTGSAKNLTLNAAGGISESGLGALKNVAILTTTSATGTTLNGANTISTFNASDNSATGISLINTIATLTVTGINETGGGNISINNTGRINNTTAGITTSGNVNLTASTNITQSGGGKVSAALLTISSKTGANLTGANTVNSFNASNITSGNIAFTNTAAPLTITGINQSGGGTTSVTNTGATLINGAITGGTGTVAVSASGLLTVNNNITTTNRAISLTGNGITQNAGASTNTIINSGSANITFAAGTGALTTTSNGVNGSQILSTGNISLTANSMTIDTTANSQIGGTGIGTGNASNIILKQTTATTPIFVATTGAGLELSSAELSSMRATRLRVGDNNSGLLTIGAWTPTQTYSSAPGVITLNSGGGITQTGALVLSANSNLILRGSGSQALTNTSNVLNTIATSLTSGSINVKSSGINPVTVSSLTDDIGSVNGITAPGGVTIESLNSGITLNQNIVSANSSANIVLSGTTFQNNAGASALQPGSSGRFLVYSSDLNSASYNSQRGGLSYNFKEYNISYPASPTPLTGNGFLYTIAPVVSPALVGSVVKFYDGNDAATLTPANYAATGNIDGDTITFNNPVNGFYDNKEVGTSKPVSVSGINLVGASNGSATVYGYQQSGTSASNTIGSILSAGLTITGFTSSNKVYTATTDAAVVTAGSLTSGQIPFGDDVTLDASGVTASFANKNVANNKIVTATGYLLTGTDAINYYIINPTTLADITPASLTVTGITANNKVYDGTTNATLNTGAALLSGVLLTDVVNLNATGSIGTFASKNVGTAIVVTATNIALTGTDAGNYIVNPLPTGLTANIEQAVLTYTANTQSKIYGDANPVLSGTITGFVPGENQANATTGTLSFTTLADNTSNVGSYTIDGSGLTANLNNYSFVQAAGNATALTITQRPLNFSGTRPYNTNTTFTAAQLTVSNIVNSDTVIITGSANVPSKNVGSYTSFATNSLISSNTNYSVTGGAISASITPVTLTYTANAATRVYGDTNPAFTGTITGFVGGEGQASATTGTMSFLSPATVTSNVGIYAINGSGLTANNGNYVFTQAISNATALTINQRPLNFTGSRVYDGTTAFSAAQLTTGNIVNGDTVNITGAIDVSSINVGNYPSFASSTLLSSNANYSVTGGVNSVSITPAQLTYTANAASRIYGDANPALSGTISGFIAGENQGNATTGTMLFSTPATVTSNVGNYAINGSGLNANNGNYTFIQAPANSTALTIGQRSLNFSGTRVYNGSQTMLASVLTLGNVVNGDTVTLGGSATISSQNVGSYNTFATNVLTSSNSNYNVIGGSVNVSITPALLNYTSNTVTRVYGDANPALNGTVTGFVSGENIANATTGTLNFSTTTTITSNVGSYAITGAGLTAINGNYTFAQAAGNATALTITQRPLDLSGSRLYNATPTFNANIFTVSNIVNGDTVNLTGSANVSSNNVNTYNSFTINNLISSNTNYNVTGGSITAEITPATLIYNANSQSRVYGASNPTFTGNVTGFAPGDTIVNATTGTLGFSSSATVTSNIGSYAVNGSGLVANNGNYTFSQAVGNATALTITAAPLTITANAASKTYGTSDPAFTYTTTGLVNGDLLIGALNRTITSQADENTGTHAILQGTLTASSNYTLTYNSANLTITPATLTITANPITKAYGSADPTLTYQQTGLVTNTYVDGILINDTISGSQVRTAGENVGVYPISQGSIAASSNYLINYTGNNFDITPAILTANLVNTATKVYDTTTAATLTNSNYTLSGILYGENVTLNNTANGTYDNANVGSNKLVTVNGLTLSGSAAGNYQLASSTINGNIGFITPAALIVNGIIANNKLYDGETNATLNKTGASLSGIIGSDMVSLNYGQELANFVSKNVGNNIAVIVNNIGLTGADASNYILIQPSGLRADILPSQLSLTEEYVPYNIIFSPLFNTYIPPLIEQEKEPLGQGCERVNSNSQICPDYWFTSISSDISQSTPSNVVFQ